jgi:maleylpyruvate isomerase
VAVRPNEEIEGIRAGQARLEVTLARITPADLAQPSLLPGWTVGHVLAHLLGNGYSVVRRLEAVIADRIADQYPGGPAGRAEEIDRLAQLPPDQLMAALGTNAREVDALLDAVPDEAWDRPTRGVSGTLNPAHRVVFSRWREVEVHHADLGLGYTLTDWPANFVARCLPDLLADLPDRTEPAALAAWLMGRGPAPELANWG